MKKIVYFKKIEEVTSKSEYTNMITSIFGRRLDVYSEEGSIYVLTDPKLAYLTENIDEIMELEMNNIIFKHISCKEVQNEDKIQLKKVELEIPKSSFIEDKEVEKKVEKEVKHTEKIIEKNVTNNSVEPENIEESYSEQAATEDLEIKKSEINKEHDLKITEENESKNDLEKKIEDLAIEGHSPEEILEDSEVKVPKKEKNIKTSPRLKKTRREEVPDIFEEKKVEKSFGVKEFFAVIFTILFALVNVYLWMLINSKDR